MTDKAQQGWEKTVLTEQEINRTVDRVSRTDLEQPLYKQMSNVQRTFAKYEALAKLQAQHSYQAGIADSQVEIKRAFNLMDSSLRDQAELYQEQIKVLESRLASQPDTLLQPDHLQHPPTFATDNLMVDIRPKTGKVYKMIENVTLAEIDRRALCLEMEVNNLILANSQAQARQRVEEIVEIVKGWEKTFDLILTHSPNYLIWKRRHGVSEPEAKPDPTFDQNVERE